MVGTPFQRARKIALNGGCADSASKRRLTDTSTAEILGSRPKPQILNSGICGVSATRELHRASKGWWTPTPNAPLPQRSTKFSTAARAAKHPAAGRDAKFCAARRDAELVR